MNDQIKDLLQQYDKLLLDRGVDARQWSEPLQLRERLEHARWMISEMAGGYAQLCISGIAPQRWSDQKMNRWLGFIQGTLHAAGLVTIADLRDQIRHLYDEP